MMTFEEAEKTYQNVKKEKRRVPYQKELPIEAILAIKQKYKNWFDFLKSEDDYSKSPSNPKMSRYISNEQMIAEIRDVYAKLGFPPRRQDYKRTVTALNHFGSWRNFLKAAGIKATFVGHSRYTKEEIIYRFQKYIDEYGEFPLTDEVEMTGVSVDTVFRMFGSLSNLAKEMNVEIDRPNTHASKEKKILQAAKELSDADIPITRTSVAKQSGLKATQVSSTIDLYKRQHHLNRLTFIQYMKIHGFDAEYSFKKKNKDTA